MWVIVGDSSFNFKHIKRIELSKEDNVAGIYFSTVNEDSGSIGVLINVRKGVSISEIINKIEKLSSEHLVLDIEDLHKELMT